MAVKNRAGACCCGGTGPCTPELWNATSTASSGTETMESVVHNKYQMQVPSGDHLWQFADGADYIVFEISNGDLYRISLPTTPFFNGPGITVSIDLSTDSGTSWTTQKDCFMMSNTSGFPGQSPASYFDDAQCGSESPTLAADYVADAWIIDDGHVVYFGENDDGCYIGVSAIGLDGNVSDDTLEVNTTNIAMIASGTARGRMLTGFDVFSSGNTISDVYALRVTSGSMLVYHTRFGTYEGFNCVSDTDPNCTVCEASFPAVALDCSSMEFSVSSTDVTKTVTVDGDFPASDGFCSLVMASDTDLYLSGGLVVVSDYTGTSQTEWSTVGVVREMCCNNTVTHDFDNLIGFVRSAPCEANAEANALAQWQQVPSYAVSVREDAAGGFPQYGGAARPFAPEYTWTVNAGETAVTSISASVSTSYDGSFYQPTDVSSKSCQMTLEVVSETDCSVVLQLTVDDFTLIHGDTSVISSGSPDWDASIDGVSVNGFGALEFDVDVSNTYAMPTGDGRVTVRMIARVTGDTGGSFQAGTSEYPNHAENATVDEAEVEGYLAGGSAGTPGGFGIIESGTRLDPDWTTWQVVFRKTVLKTDLAYESVTIDFDSADLHSSNNPTGRVTLKPYDYSQGYSIVSQQDATSVSWPYHLLIAKNDGYGGTTSISESDFSASVTLSQGPWYKGVQP